MPARGVALRLKQADEVRARGAGLRPSSMSPSPPACLAGSHAAVHVDGTFTAAQLLPRGAEDHNPQVAGSIINMGNHHGTYRKSRLQHGLLDGGMRRSWGFHPRARAHEVRARNIRGQRQSRSVYKIDTDITAPLARSASAIARDASCQRFGEPTQSPGPAVYSLQRRGQVHDRRPGPPPPPTVGWYN